MNNTKARLREEAIEQAMQKYRDQLQVFSIEELLWDVGCNVPPYIRAAIMREFTRRGTTYAAAQSAHGRGKPNRKYR